MKKGISIGIILLFIISAVSPMVVGFEADDINDEEEELLDELALCCYDGSGNMTLITESLAGRVIEVDSAGNEVWNMTGLHVPKDAERCSSSNTLIAEYGANRVIEVDSTGTIVWIITGLDGPVDVEILDIGMLITEYLGGRVFGGGWEITGLDGPADAERLDNGNTLIAEYTGGRIIEVNSSGNIVWEITGLLGPIDAERLNNNNEPPNAPIIDGPTCGRVGVKYEYTFNSTDDDAVDFLEYVVFFEPDKYVFFFAGCLYVFFLW